MFGYFWSHKYNYISIKEKNYLKYGKINFYFNYKSLKFKVMNILNFLSNPIGSRMDFKGWRNQTSSKEYFLSLTVREIPEFRYLNNVTV